MCFNITKDFAISDAISVLKLLGILDSKHLPSLPFMNPLAMLILALRLF